MLRLIRFAICAAFFLVGWWLRPDWLPRQPYYVGFLFTLPVGAAIGLWLLSGAPGFRAACRDARRWWLVGLFALAIWMILSPAWAKYQSVASGAWQQFVVVALFAVVVLCAGPSARTLAVALALGLIVQAVVVIGQTLIQRPVGLQTLGEFEIRPGRRGLSIVQSGEAELMRPYGLTIHPNVIGGYLVVGLLAQAGYLVRGSQGEQRAALWRWLVRLAVALIGLWAVCLTFSRSAWGALLIGLGVIALASLRRGADRLSTRLSMGRILIVAGSATLVAVAFVLAYSDFIWARAGVGAEETEQISIASRRVFGEMALRVWRDHPLAGTGVGTFPWEARDLIARGPLRGQLAAENVHSVPLLALSELGLVGFALYYGTLAFGAILVWRTVRDPFAVGLAAGAVALAAVGVLDHYPWTVLHFAALQFGLCAAALNDRARSARSFHSRAR